MLYDDSNVEKPIKKESFSLQDNNKSLVLFLAALCFFLSAVENSIPKPLPFMRLGLANAPIIFALFLLHTREYFFLVFIKVLGQAIISGTLFSYILLFSAGGSFASALAMFVLQRLGKKHVSCLGISLFGALGNTLVQYILARYLLFGSSAILIAPLLLLSGIITGLALGVFSEVFLKQSKWFLYSKEGREAKNIGKKMDQNLVKGRKKRSFSWEALVPAFFVFISIVFFNLFQAYGKVLWTIGRFEITSGALFSGIKRASILTAMVFVSKLLVSSSFRLPGKWGKTLDIIFYYLAMLTEKNIDKDENSIQNEESRSNRKKIFSLHILRSIDMRLIEVFY